MMKSRTTRGGFTLIELLVVIAVIGVLISIALPALNGARKRSRTVACMAQTKQLTTAIAAFTGSNRGQLPENRPLVNPKEHVTWRHILVRDGYMTLGKGWACPSHPYPGVPGGEQGQMDNGTMCVGDVASSYAVNGHLVWREKKRPSERDVAEAKIQRPSHTLLTAETTMSFPDTRVVNMIIASEDASGRGVYGYWHAGMGVYGFQDTHAETIRLMDTGNPDCRWHNGPDLTEDEFFPQTPEEKGIHAHPDWEYLLPKVYLPGKV